MADIGCDPGVLDDLLADMHERNGNHDQAARLRASAREDRECRSIDAAELDEQLESLTTTLGSILDAVPEPAKSVKHSEDCWQRHAHCLAAKIRTAVE